MTNETRERERALHGEALRLAAAAEAALQNEAIMAYYETAERTMIDAMLACEDREDLDRLRIGAQTIRKLKAFLHEAVAGADYARQMIERIDKEEGVR